MAYGGDVGDNHLSISDLHAAARAYAEAGIPVFPCVENGKEPACAHGFRDATTNLEQINEWWEENPRYNIGLEPERAGWAVLDPDGPEGEATLAALPALPQTYTVRSPRGGRHLYFEGSLPGTVSRLGSKLDTRGRGSYILVPPSIVGGRHYTVIDDCDPAPLPAWVEEKIGAGREHVQAAVSELDLPGNIERAEVLLRGYVKRGHVAIEGQGGDSRTYAVCAEVLNLGVSPERALDMIDEIWNTHCVPPWTRDELGVKIENASRYAQNEPGAWAVPPAREAFAGTVLDKLLAESASEPVRRSKFYFEDEDEQEQGKEPAWLIQDLIPERSTVLLVGRTGSYKSFLALDLAIGISTGTETFGSVPSAPGPVFYGALEGRNNIKKARRRAWKIARGVDKTPDFYVGTAPMVAFEDEMQEFCQQILGRLHGRHPKLIIIDTLAKSMAGLNENDARDAGRFIRFCDALVETFGCSVLVLHHSGKDDARGARGSSAFQAGFDTVLEARAHKRTKAVAVYVVKQKDAEEKEAPWTFEGKEVGSSLVFFPTSAAEHHALTAKDDPLDRLKVGAALQSLNAYGLENGVTTNVLAQTMAPGNEADTQETRAALQSKTARVLGSLSKTRLDAYCTKQPSGLVWHLPERA